MLEEDFWNVGMLECWFPVQDDGFRRNNEFYMIGGLGFWTQGTAGDFLGGQEAADEQNNKKQHRFFIFSMFIDFFDFHVKNATKTHQEMIYNSGVSAVKG